MIRSKMTTSRLHLVTMSLVLLSLMGWILCDVTYAPCPASCACLGNTVDCSARKLRRVPDDLPYWVEVLDMSSNGLLNISADPFDGLANLRELNLNGNKLKNISGKVFDNLPRLQVLKAAHNGLSQLWETNGTSNLTHLLLSHNSINQLNASVLWRNPNLRVLDLSFNSIEHLRNGTFSSSLDNLRQLYLSDNKIESIEKGSLEQLTSLEWLKLNKNKIASLQPNVFSRLSKLKYLELNQNRLRRIEALRFQGLTSLVTLRLKRNSLTELMDGAFWGLSRIENLQLDYNSLAKISSGFLFGMESLEQLSVSHNKLTVIEPDSWTSCKHLIELDLSQNEMASISDATFLKLESLQLLRLSHNRISYITEHAFRDLTSLRVLELSENEISSTLADSPGVFVGLSSLTRLTLDANRITSIAKGAFSGLSQLKGLHLEGNAVSSLENNAFESLSHLEQLALNSSNLFCDCHLSWLPDWLQQTGFHLTSTAVCGFPATISGWSVMDVKADNFKCDDYAKPSITKDPLSHIALKDGSLNLTCQVSASSHSTVTIEWKKDHATLRNSAVSTVSVKSGTRTSVVEYTSQLLISPVKNEHAGHYQCVASNSLGTAYSAKAEINVSVFPRFVKTPSDVTVRAGTTARLECSASGQPTPEVAWTKDGGYDFPAARERRMHVMPSDDVFFIVDATREDQGVYTCTARNDAGVVRINASLVVLQAPSFVTTTTRVKDCPAGQTAVLECLSSHPNSRYRLEWYKDGAPLHLTPRHHFAADSQLLVITAVQAADAGEYTCVMSNTLGSERSTLRLDVMLTSSGEGGGKSLLVVDGRGGDEETAKVGVVVIAVVVCIVGTSLVWVAVICRLRRRRRGGVEGKEAMGADVAAGKGFNFLHVARDERALMQASPLLWGQTRPDALSCSDYTPRTLGSPCDYSSPDDAPPSCAACQCLDSGCFCNELVRPTDEAVSRLLVRASRPNESGATPSCKHRSNHDCAPVSAASVPLTTLAVESCGVHLTPTIFSCHAKSLRGLGDSAWQTASDGDLSSMKNSVADRNFYLRPSPLPNDSKNAKLNSCSNSVSSCDDLRSQENLPARHERISSIILR